MLNEPRKYKFSDDVNIPMDIIFVLNKLKVLIILELVTTK